MATFSCATKSSFENRERAEQALKDAQATSRLRLGKNYPCPIRVYQCHTCGEWHLTSHTENSAPSDSQAFAEMHERRRSDSQHRAAMLAKYGKFNTPRVVTA